MKFDLNALKALAKSRTFWGGLIFAIAKFLESQGVMNSEASSAVESVGVAIGLFGARNTKGKGPANA